MEQTPTFTKPDNFGNLGIASSVGLSQRVNHIEWAVAEEITQWARYLLQRAAPFIFQQVSASSIFGDGIAVEEQFYERSRSFERAGSET